MSLTNPLKLLLPPPFWEARLHCPTHVGRLTIPILKLFAFWYFKTLFYFNVSKLPPQHTSPRYPAFMGHQIYHTPGGISIHLMSYFNEFFLNFHDLTDILALRLELLLSQMSFNYWKKESNGVH
jgi:hypothetical protein